MLFQVAVVKNKQNRFSMKAVGFQTHCKAFCGRIFLTLVYNSCIVNDKKGGRFSPVHLLFQFTSEKNFDKKLLFIIAILKKRCILYDQISETHTNKGYCIMTSSAEMNLTRFAKTSLAADFVKNHHGEWNHRDWLEFCAYLEDQGYTPIDLDQVGLLLEKNKTEYFNGNL